jgi:hypothetical protein
MRLVVPSVTTFQLRYRCRLQPQDILSRNACFPGQSSLFSVGSPSIPFRRHRRFVPHTAFDMPGPRKIPDTFTISLSPWNISFSIQRIRAGVPALSASLANYQSNDCLIYCSACSAARHWASATGPP